eukprot:CAMPEP_0205800516 /NCGR_PEP_ID=MMETSP0205-20121125/2188_1 /ASSEMBLY_ACC=CAM_ASM_000278 /TAXON_ID=36767 /ORGANISM="Euplotes focardii, Strain TN1" /LENGTH=277 /DNA_ID=CAMNT_0053063709 /DNA_START=46 /DNA_END=879 /DNA_ORIENTATION=+
MNNLLLRKTNLSKKPIQYASAYFIRLEELRPALREAATSKWDKCQIIEEIVSITPKTSECVVIGTLFKEMKLKPSIVLDMVALLGKKAASYIDESDSILIEDQTGRMKIDTNEVINPANFVTGTVVAMKGRINTNGSFQASDFTFPGIPSIMTMPENFDHLVGAEENKEDISLFEDLENREFLCFVSGMEFGSMKEKTSLEILLRFFLGQYGTSDERLLNSRVSRIILAGNNIGEEQDINDIIKGSYRTADLNERTYTNISTSIEQFETFVSSVSKV